MILTEASTEASTADVLEQRMSVLPAGWVHNGMTVWKAERGNPFLGTCSDSGVHVQGNTQRCSQKHVIECYMHAL